MACPGRDGAAGNTGVSPLRYAPVEMTAVGLRSGRDDDNMCWAKARGDDDGSGADDGSFR